MTAARALIDGDYDVVVIGGGMAGAGAARDLALRGLTVALVDKGDFASATTALSSKLIHGGLRYLELFDVGLVRESLRERETLRRLAPHLVKPLPFLIPSYHAAIVTAVIVVGFELVGLAWIRWRFFDTSFVKSLGLVSVGGAVIAVVGCLVGAGV